jgi:uncharacterized protein (TIRG00374 family)
MKIAFNPALLKKAERWVIALIGLTVAATVGISLFASGDGLIHNLAKTPWWAVFWLLVATVVESLLRFWRYHVAAKALGLKVPFGRMMFYYTVGYGLIPTPGKVGTAIRVWLLKQYHGLPYSRTAPLLVMDLVSDSLAMFALASFSLLVLDDPRLKTLGIILFTALVFCTAAALFAPRYLNLCLKMLYSLTGKRKARLFARLLMLFGTTARVLGAKTLATTTALSAAGWGIVGIAIGHLVTQYGVPLGAAEGTLAITLATMGGFLTMMPAGVGGAEVTMASLFTLFAVPFGLAVLVTAIVRFIVLWLTVLVGLALLPIALRHTPTNAAARKSAKKAA